MHFYKNIDVNFGEAMSSATTCVGTTSLLPNTRKRKLPCSDSLGSTKKKVCKNSNDKEPENHVRPFWTELSKKWSDVLLSCSKRCCDDTAPNSWNPSFKKLGQNSWFSVKMQKLNGAQKSQAHQSLHETFPEHISDETGMKAMKNRIFPTKEQKSTDVTISQKE